MQQKPNPAFGSPRALRRAIRVGAFTGQTAGECRGYTQGNLAGLPAAKPPVSITHKPGCMLVTGVRNAELAEAA